VRALRAASRIAQRGRDGPTFAAEALMDRILLVGLAITLAGCNLESPAEDEASSTSAESAEEAVTREGYALPWAVGDAHAVGQGDLGVLPGGGHSDHTEYLCNGAGLCGTLMIHALDFEFDEGERVLASNAGVVRHVYDQTKPGDPCFKGDGDTGRCAGKENAVVIGHADGLETQYLHFSRVDVRVGQQVSKGQELGLAGATGQASGAHLHFQVQKPCGGSTMCQSLKISFADGIGLPKAGSFPVRSYDSGTRCWSDALDRYVHNACIEKPGAQGTWSECVGGEWHALNAAGGEQCAAGAPIYGYCKTETGDSVPVRTCHPFPNGKDYDWRQCGEDGVWMPNVVSYVAGSLGGKLGECASAK
jgi:murein DD-endopeptidase MepM/ murein hydrolase activator NlpD